jgi:glycosyltransferase involved in cell wall biosynthesis
MANALRKNGGRLLVYGEAPPEAESVLRQEPNIEWRGRVDSSQVIQQCRAEAHAMYVPMPYLELDRPNAEISFPSKLADCTAVGLPLIVDGQEYCSAVRWARENRGVAEVMTDESVDALAGAVARLRDDPAHWIQLANEAIRRGQQYFGFDRAVSILYSKLGGLRTAESLHDDDAPGVSFANSWR